MKLTVINGRVREDCPHDTISYHSDRLPICLDCGLQDESLCPEADV